MAVMIQPKFGRKILYKILGKPNAAQTKESSILRKIRKVVMYQDARLVR